MSVISEAINQLSRDMLLLNQHNVTNISIMQLTNDEIREVDLINRIFKNWSIIFAAYNGGQLKELPFIAMMEQKLNPDLSYSNKKKDTNFNGMYAVVYTDKDKWGSPLIDICGDSYYNTDTCMERVKDLTLNKPNRDKRPDRFEYETEFDYIVRCLNCGYLPRLNCEEGLRDVNP